MASIREEKFEESLTKEEAKKHYKQQIKMWAWISFILYLCFLSVTGLLMYKIHNIESNAENTRFLIIDALSEKICEQEGQDFIRYSNYDENIIVECENINIKIPWRDI